MPIPNIGSVPDVVTATVIASDWGNAIGAASRGRVVQRFNSLAERDASITAPVAGMLCYVLAGDQYYGYRSSLGWVALIGGAPDKAHVRAFRSAGMTIATTPTTIWFDSSSLDPSGMYSNPDAAIIVATPGIYQIVSNCLATNATGVAHWVYAAWGKNLAVQNGVYSPTTITYTLGTTLTDIARLAAGDKIYQYAQCDVALPYAGGYFTLTYLGSG
jgi:hypothetical protein